MYNNAPENEKADIKKQIDKYLYDLIIENTMERSKIGFSKFENYDIENDKDVLSAKEHKLNQIGTMEECEIEINNANDFYNDFYREICNDEGEEEEEEKKEEKKEKKPTKLKQVKESQVISKYKMEEIKKD